MKRWVASLLLPSFFSMTLAGCSTGGRPPEHVVAAPSQEYMDGLRDGRQAAEHGSVAGYFVLGGLAGVLVVIVCAAAIAAGGGSGGNCGGSGGNCGNGGSRDEKQYLPPDTSNRSGDYVVGYQEGYHARYEQRKDSALAAGFGIGIALFAVGAAIYLSDTERRKAVFDETESPASAGPPPRGVAIRF